MWLPVKDRLGDAGKAEASDTSKWNGSQRSPAQKSKRRGVKIAGVLPKFEEGKKAQECSSLEEWQNSSSCNAQKLD